MRVQAADRHHAPCLTEPIPLAQVVLERAADRTLRSKDHAREVAKAAYALAGVVEEAPELDAVEAVELAEGDPGSPEALGTARERVRGEAEAAGGVDGVADLRPAQVPVDLALDSECEEMVPIGGGDLLADEQKNVVVPALLAAPLCLQRVVVCQQHHVDAGTLRGVGDLRDAPRAVGVGGVNVDDAGEVVH